MTLVLKFFLATRTESMLNPLKGSLTYRVLQQAWFKFEWLNLVSQAKEFF